jgi:hypothetical protein
VSVECPLMRDILEMEEYVVDRRIEVGRGVDGLV